MYLVEVSEISGSPLGSFDRVSNVHRCAVTMLLLVRFIFKGKAQVIINLGQYTETNSNESADQK